MDTNEETPASLVGAEIDLPVEGEILPGYVESEASGGVLSVIVYGKKDRSLFSPREVAAMLADRECLEGYQAVDFEDPDGEIMTSIRVTDKDMNLYKLAAKSSGESIEEFFLSSIKEGLRLIEEKQEK